MEIVSRDTWLQERMALLKREKAVTRELDQLAKARQQLPWVRIEKDYRFHTAKGEVSLGELFGPYSQLIIYHFMFGPDWASPCTGCTGWADAFNGTVDQIECHDATLIAMSRASIEQLEKVRKARGWSFEWASSYGSDFNYDFHMSAPLDCKSVQVADEIIFYDRGESGGISVFVKNDEGIFQTYACHNRGIQLMNGAFGYVDLLPFGGN